MRFISLLIGTVLTVFFVIMSVRGKKYTAYVESLDEKDFPIKDLYVIGFALMDIKLFALKGKPRSLLINQAKLLYDAKYSEYYSSVIWAQTLSVAHLMLCAGFLLAGAFDFPFFVFVGVICAGVFAYLFLTQLKSKIEQRRMECVQELPEIVSSMALLINSGMVLKEAWKRIAFSKTGTVYDLMRKAVSDMSNGVPEIDAIHKFGILTDSPEIKKFTGALVQGLEKGSKDLSNFLTAQSSEMWGLKKQLMLQKGEAAASKLLMPIAFIFLGVMIIVIGGAIGMLI